MKENQIQEDYESFRTSCLENPVFKRMLEEVEESIISNFKKSPEGATEAYYEYKAFQKILGQIQALKHNAETQRTISNQPIDRSDY